MTKLKQMNFQIDELLQQVQLKNKFEAIRDQSAEVVEEYDCNHEAHIDRLEEMISST